MQTGMNDPLQAFMYGCQSHWPIYWCSTENLQGYSMYLHGSQIMRMQKSQKNQQGCSSYFIHMDTTVTNLHGQVLVAVVQGRPAWMQQSNKSGGSDSHRWIIAGMVVTKVLFPLKTALRGQQDIDLSTASHVCSKPVFIVFHKCAKCCANLCVSSSWFVSDSKIYIYIYWGWGGWGGGSELTFRKLCGPTMPAIWTLQSQSCMMQQSQPTPNAVLLCTTTWIQQSHTQGYF